MKRVQKNQGGGGSRGVHFSRGVQRELELFVFSDPWWTFGLSGLLVFVVPWYITWDTVGTLASAGHGELNSQLNNYGELNMRPFWNFWNFCHSNAVMD